MSSHIRTSTGHSTCGSAGRIVALSLIVMAMTISLSCQPKQDSAPSMSSTNPTSSTSVPSPADSPNKALLSEANQAAKWFHAKKTRPIWVKRIEAAATVKTLEGEVPVNAGHFLCRGEAGDIWPQTEKDLNKRYASTEEVDSDGWRKYTPHADAQGVMAIQIDHPFEVQTKWGKLSGKQGDFLIKNYGDAETAYPDDVWLVDQKLFGQTYATVTKKQ